jgi:hypothetical protein
VKNLDYTHNSHREYFFWLREDSSRASLMISPQHPRAGLARLHWRPQGPRQDRLTLDTQQAHATPYGLPSSFGSRICSGLSPIVYAEHIERTGIALFEKACELDLEGIVAKDGRAPYDPQRSAWFKIRNRNYSQFVRREELFARETHRTLFRDGTRVF